MFNLHLRSRTEKPRLQSQVCSSCVGTNRAEDGVILPAVDHHWSRVLRPGFGGLLDEAEQRQAELWDAHVGPMGVMVLSNSPLQAPPLLRALQETNTKLGFTGYVFMKSATNWIFWVSDKNMHMQLKKIDR